MVPRFGKLDRLADKKQIMIGWTSTDGKAFSHMASPMTPPPELINIFTEDIFRGPGINLAKQLRAQGHPVTAFELQWAPEDFVWGPDAPHRPAADFRV